MRLMSFLRRFTLALLASGNAWRLADAAEHNALCEANQRQRRAEASELAKRTIYPAEQFERGLAFGKTPEQLERCAVMSAMRGDTRLNWWH